MFLHGEPYEPKSVDDARAQGIDTVFQDLALIDELSVYHNMFLRRERVHRPIPFLSNALMRGEARKALDDIGINIPRLDVPVARLSGGQRQSIAVARTVYGEANILLLDEPLAAMGAKEGGMILELIERLKEEGNVSIMMVLHNYVHVLATCDRVNLIQDGMIALDKPTAETSVEELTQIVVEEYRRAREEAIAADAARGRSGTDGPRGEPAADTRSASTSARSPGARCCSTSSSGAEAAVSEVRYAHGVIDRELPATGEELPPDWALQHPDDWVAVLEQAIPAVLEQVPAAREAVVGLGVDFTSCTVLPVTAEGTPLIAAGALARARRHAWPKLWKHHAAQPVADRLNEVAAARGEPFLARYGGRISSEWYFPKLIELWLEDREVYDACDGFIEATDWIVWYLTGNERRQSCTAGYKAMWSPQEGLPPGRLLRGRLSRVRPRPQAKLGTRVRAARHARGDAAAAGRGTARASPRRWRSPSATSTRSSRSRAPASSRRERS